MAFAKFGQKIKQRKKSAFKFKLSTCYDYIECEFQKDYTPNNLCVKWSRGHRETVSPGPKWIADSEDERCVKGRASFEPGNSVDLLITLYKANKTVEYDEKSYKYSIEDTTASGKKIVLGVIELNVAEYANVTEHKYEMELNCKTNYKKVNRIMIVMTLKVEFLKSGSAHDDDMISTWSALPGTGGLDISDDEGDENNEGGIRRDRCVSTDLASIMGESLLSLVTLKKQEFMQLDGNSRDLSYLNACKAILLLFSANWSDPCIKFLQLVDKFYSQINLGESKPLEVIYVSCDYDDDILKQSLQKHSIPYSAIKPKSELAENLKEHYEIAIIPQLILVSPETGRVIEKDGKSELEKCQNSPEELKMLSLAWSKGKSLSAFSKSNLSTDLAHSASNVSLASAGLEGISEGGNFVLSGRRKGSVKQTNLDQNISNLESRLRQKESELRESSEKLDLMTEKVADLESENDTLRSKQFEMNEEIRHLKIIVKEFRDQNQAMAEEKQELVAAMNVSGWLFKRGISGPTGRLWRRRYFQSNGYFLSYYKSPNIQVEQGSIDLRKVREFEVLPIEQQDKNQATFNIVTEGRTYELQARSPEDMNTWLKAVKCIVKYHRENKLASLIVFNPNPNISGAPIN